MKKNLLIVTVIFYSCASDTNKAEQKQDTSRHIRSERPQISVTSKKETVDSSFLFFWKEFTDVVKSKNRSKLKELSFDSLDCEHKNINVDEFIKSNFHIVFDDVLLSKLSEPNRVEFVDEEVITSYLPPFVLKQVSNGELTIKKKVNVTKIDKYPAGPLTIVLEFIETKKGYKFYGYDKFG